MGYTHSWKFKKTEKIEFNKIQKIRTELNKVLVKYKKHLQFEYDIQSPIDFSTIYKDDEIGIHLRFNGIGENGHETFFIYTLDSESVYCKTARKYYDKAVCECLLILKYYFKEDMLLDSDGFSNEQPYKKKKYIKGDIVKWNIDGYWSQSLRNVNKQLNSNMYFECTKSYGNDNCYFSYELKC